MWVRIFPKCDRLCTNEFTVCQMEGAVTLFHCVTAPSCCLITSFPFDFATGSIHWVNGFDFDHRAEFWKDINVELLYNQYYDSMLALVNSGLFTGLAHPDSIKCFHFFPAGDLTPKYRLLADALNRHHMYAEQSGGLALNYGFPEMGMNLSMLDIFKRENVQIQFASDAHRPEDVGKNISEMRSALYQ